MNELARYRVGVLAEDHFEDLELWYPVIRMREAGAGVSVLGVDSDRFKRYRGHRGLSVMPDVPAHMVRAADLDALIVPGGFAPDRLRVHEPVKELVRDMDRKNKVLAFICRGGRVMVSAGIVKGRRVTSDPSTRDDLINAGAIWEDSPVVVDHNLLSTRSPDDLHVFGAALISLLGRRTPGAHRSGE